MKHTFPKLSALQEEEVHEMITNAFNKHAEEAAKEIALAIQVLKENDHHPEVQDLELVFGTDSYSIIECGNKLVPSHDLNGRWRIAKSGKLSKYK